MGSLGTPQWGRGSVRCSGRTSRGPGRAGGGQSQSPAECVGSWLISPPRTGRLAPKPKSSCSEEKQSQWFCPNCLWSSGAASGWAAWVVVTLDGAGSWRRPLRLSRERWHLRVNDCPAQGRGAGRFRLNGQVGDGRAASSARNRSRPRGLGTDAGRVASGKAGRVDARELEHSGGSPRSVAAVGTALAGKGPRPRARLSVSEESPPPAGGSASGPGAGHTWTLLHLAAPPACAQPAGPHLQSPEAFGAGGGRGGQTGRQALLEGNVELLCGFSEAHGAAAPPGRAPQVPRLCGRGTGVPTPGDGSLGS